MVRRRPCAVSGRCDASPGEPCGPAVAPSFETRRRRRSFGISAIALIPEMRVRALAYPLNLSNSAVFNKHKFAISPHHLREVCQQTSRPRRSEGAGKTGCALHPRSRVQTVHQKTHTSIQVQREHPWPSLRSGFTTYFVLSPVNGFVATVAPEKLASQELDASTAASGPHDFAVRIRRVRLFAPFASTASHRTFVTIATRPSSAVRRA